MRISAHRVTISCARYRHYDVDALNAAPWMSLELELKDDDGNTLALSILSGSPQDTLCPPEKLERLKAAIEEIWPPQPVDTGDDGHSSCSHFVHGLCGS